MSLLMGAEPVFRPFPGLSAASQALAEWCAGELRGAIKARGTATIAVPGGSTPGLFLQALARQDLPWKRITLLPTDERLVPADHPRSNERMHRTALEPALAKGARWLSFAPGILTDRAALALALGGAVTPLLPLSVAVLGMGDDGHIASLFPGDARLLQPDPRGPAVWMAEPVGLEARLTLTPAVLQSAKALALLFSGKRKQAVFAEAVRQRDKPVALLLGAAVPLQVFCVEDV